MLGYLLGFIFSAAIAIVALYFIIGSIVATAFGNSSTNALLVLITALAGYLSTAYVLALFADRIFDSNQVLAFLVNVAPIPAFVGFSSLSGKYHSYARIKDNKRAAQIAIDEAPDIHLGEIFVKAIDNPLGGAVLLAHVPLTVTKTVQARSVIILVGILPPRLDIKFSPNPNCNGGYFDKPEYSVYIVDREYAEFPLPSETSQRKITSEQLQPDKRYYLLREYHFTYSRCRMSDYRDFDPKQLNVSLDIANANRLLEAGQWI